MKKTTLFYLLVLLTIGLITTACSGTDQSTAQAAPPAQEEAKVENFISVEVAEVVSGDIAQFFDYAGDLQPQKQINITPEVGGKVERLLVEVGDQVVKGDPIAILERDTYLAELKQAQAALRSAAAELQRLESGSRPAEISVAQASVQSAKAQLNEVITIDDDERTQAATNLATTQAELKRAQEEYDKIAWAGDVGTRQEAVDLEKATIAYETALADYNIKINPRDSEVAPLMERLAQAELTLELALDPYREFDFEAARAGIEQAEATLELAQIRLGKTTIEAPFDGVISDLHIEEGSLVSTQATISEIVSNEVEVLVNVEESRIGQIFEGQNATLNVQAYPNVNFPAVVTEIDPTGDTASHTFPVTITAVDEKGLLKSGMYADLSLLSEEKQNVPLIPRAAIVNLAGQPTVYVVIDDNVAEQRSVTTGLTNANQVEILSGLEPGDIVVIAGQPNLADGASVEIVSGF